MEREQEITKLINVLHRIARAAAYSSWVKTDEHAVKFCSAQYNKILRRLKELEPAIASLFSELADEASPTVVRMAAHDLAAYFEDEVPGRRRGGAFGHCGSRRVVFAGSPTWGRCS